MKQIKILVFVPLLLKMLFSIITLTVLIGLAPNITRAGVIIPRIWDGGDFGTVWDIDTPLNPPYTSPFTPVDDVISIEYSWGSDIAIGNPDPNPLGPPVVVQLVALTVNVGPIPIHIFPPIEPGMFQLNVPGSPTAVGPFLDMPTIKGFGFISDGLFEILDIPPGGQGLSTLTFNLEVGSNASVPEPSPGVLLGISLIGLAGVGAVRKIKRKAVVKVNT